MADYSSSSKTSDNRSSGGYYRYDFDNYSIYGDEVSSNQWNDYNYSDDNHHSDDYVHKGKKYKCDKRKKYNSDHVNKCGCKNRCKCKPEHKSKCKPTYYCEKWPPNLPDKKGGDICVGDIDSNNINADTIKAGPEKIYIPGRRYKTLGDALRSMRSPELGGPIGGYHVILKSGRHILGTDHNLPIRNLIIEAERWSPTMANPYFVGHGHSMRIVTRYFDFYDKCIGGLGPYCIDVCKNRITVTSRNKYYNPNFDGLRGCKCGDYIGRCKCYSDYIYWRDKCGKIKCYRIKEAKCNNIWIYGCLDSCKPEMGEGFWVGNNTTIQFSGQRQLLLSPGGNLQYRGIHMTMIDDETCNMNAVNPQIITGASNGVTSMIHSHVEDNLLLYGGPSWLTPNIVTAIVRLTAGSTGIILYAGLINQRARAILDQSLVLFGANLLLGADIGIESWGSAAANLIGSSVHNCKIGAKVIGGTFNCPGTLFSSNGIGIQARSSGKIISSVTEFEGLAPIAMITNDIAFDFDNKIAAESDIVITRNNTNDLSIDGETFNKLSDYPSGQFQSRASTYVYIENQS